MESSDASASPAGEAGHVAVAGGAGKRETNASSQLTAPEATGRRETKEPCPMETAEIMGARETNVPEERSAALRRDGEPLTSAAKRRRQTETDAEEQQADAGERSPSPVREDEEEPPPLVEDPAGQQVSRSGPRQSPAARGAPTRIQSPSSALRRYCVRKREGCLLGISRTARSIYRRLR